MNIRDMIEGIIVIVCGMILLSPGFNTMIEIPQLVFLSHIHDEVISHLAIALVPVSVVFFIDMFRKA